jgi:predicted HAD superfamily Cof-like phosphohydrolase
MSIRDVRDFHYKFGFPTGDEDVLSGNTPNQNFRAGFLREELNELETAMRTGNRVGAFDALLDLVYVAHGTALNLGISPFKWHCGMSEVHKANMAKVRVERAEDSKRGHAMDVVKPEGWVGPEQALAKILETEEVPATW